MFSLVIQSVQVTKQICTKWNKLRDLSSIDYDGDVIENKNHRAALHKLSPLKPWQFRKKMSV